jgi:hypothetical protein
MDEITQQVRDMYSRYPFPSNDKIENELPGYLPEFLKRALNKSRKNRSKTAQVVLSLLEKQEKVTVMSGQAGMNAYYLAEQFYGRVEFMDRRALSTRHYEVLMEEMGLGTTTYGLDLTLEALFAEAQKREGPIWSPDLIFDIVEKEMLDDRNGYRIMHEQIGKGAPYIENPRSALHATFGPEGSIKFKCRLPLGQYIAVREDLADRFESTTFDWNEERRLRLVDSP